MLRRATGPTVLTVVITLALTALHGGEPGKKPAKDGPPLEIDGQLLDTDPRDPVHNQPCKIYTVKLKKDKTYLIDMASDAFDTYLRLEDAQGKQLGEDDDGGGDTDSQIVHAPDADGTFKVYATRFGDDGVGNFKLKVRELSYKVGKASDLPADGLKVDGQLTNDDPTDEVGPREKYKIYSVNLKAGKAYTIDLRSDAFDSFLRVHDARFRKLAEDDDSGGDLHSRLTFRPDADGVFHIIATTLDGDLGQFTLTVRQEK